MAIIRTEQIFSEKSPDSRGKSERQNLHAELVDRAAKWLRGRGGCKVVLTEYRHGGGEEPDALGLHPLGSVLIECKTTRADFLADAQKPWRKSPSTGLGVERYFMAPKGLISPDELPEKWGLLEVRGKRVFILKKAEAFDPALVALAERPILYSVMRRLVLQDKDLLAMCIDLGKMETRLTAKAVELTNLERALTMEERRLSIRKERVIKERERIKKEDW